MKRTLIIFELLITFKHLAEFHQLHHCHCYFKVGKLVFHQLQETPWRSQKQEKETKIVREKETQKLNIWARKKRTVKVLLTVSDERQKRYYRNAWRTQSLAFEALLVYPSLHRFSYDVPWFLTLSSLISIPCAISILQLCLFPCESFSFCHRHFRGYITWYLQLH